MENQNNNKANSSKGSIQSEISKNPMDQFSDIVNLTVENIMGDEDSNPDEKTGKDAGNKK